MPCSLCKDEDHKTSRCPELSEERRQSTFEPNKEQRHDDGEEEESLILKYCNGSKKSQIPL